MNNTVVEYLLALVDSQRERAYVFSQRTDHGKETQAHWESELRKANEAHAALLEMLQ